MKFTLTVNAAQKEGFHVTFTADNSNELDLVNSLMEKIIEKITKIEVVVVNNTEDHYD